MYLLRNLYAGQDATVRTIHETTDWFKIGKGVHQSYVLSPCLFNLYAENIMPGWMKLKLESRLWGKISTTSGMTTLMAESKEELKGLLMRVKEESEKADLELNIQKTKIMASGGHEMALLLGRKAMTNLDSILRSRDITSSTKVCLVKAIVFLVVMYGCESWTIKKARLRRIDAFELWY